MFFQEATFQELSFFDVRNKPKIVRQGIFIEIALCYNIECMIGENYQNNFNGYDKIITKKGELSNEVSRTCC